MSRIYGSVYTRTSSYHRICALISGEPNLSTKLNSYFQNIVPSEARWYLSKCCNVDVSAVTVAIFFNVPGSFTSSIHLGIGPEPLYARMSMVTTLSEAQLVVSSKKRRRNSVSVETLVPYTRKTQCRKGGGYDRYMSVPFSERLRIHRLPCISRMAL